VALLLGLMCAVSSEDCLFTLVDRPSNTVTDIDPATLANVPLLDAHSVLMAQCSMSVQTNPAYV
jgi:hypothetical protein